MKGYYKCECGKEFTNPQSFNGHKSNCKIHLQSKGSYEQQLQQRKISNEKGKITQQNNSKIKKQQELEKWISEQHTCEKCGKVMTGKFGSGRFCSRSCANSRNQTEEINNKRRYSIQKYLENTVQKTSDSTSIKQDVLFSIDLTEYKKKLDSKNIKVLEEYKNLLKQKSNNKVFQLQNKPFMYAKYWSIWDTQHPRNNMGCVFVHILLAESLLDRHLTKEEIVHHINENKLDNRYDNILIFDTKASHSRFHNSSHFRIYIKEDVLMCVNVPITNPKCGIMKIKDEFKYKKLLSYLD